MGVGMAIYRITIVGADGEGDLEATVERIANDQSQSDGVEVQGHQTVGGLLQTAGRMIHEWGLHPQTPPRSRKRSR